MTRYGDSIDFGGDSRPGGYIRKMLGSFLQDANVVRDSGAASRDVGSAGLSGLLGGNNSMTIPAKKPMALANQSFSGGSQPASRSYGGQEGSVVGNGGRPSDVPVDRNGPVPNGHYTPSGMRPGLFPGSWANPDYASAFGVQSSGPTAQSQQGQPAQSQQASPVQGSQPSGQRSVDMNRLGRKYDGSVNPNLREFMQGGSWGHVGDASSRGSVSRESVSQVGQAGDGQSGSGVNSSADGKSRDQKFAEQRIQYGDSREVIIDKMKRAITNGFYVYKDGKWLNKNTGVPINEDAARAVQNRFDERNPPPLKNGDSLPGGVKYFDGRGMNPNRVENRPMPVSQPSVPSVGSGGVTSGPPLTAQEHVERAMSSDVEAGRYVPSAGGRFVNSQTGALIENDYADEMQRRNADNLADQAHSDARWNEGFGVGDQMNRKRRAEDQAIQSGWNDWYDRRAANDDAVAAQFGVERRDVRDEREREIRLRDEAMRQRIAQEHPDFAAKRAAYNERLADSASRNDDAVAQRHRYERGVPSSPTEAMMFAVTNGLRQDPVRSMVAYGSGMDSLGDNEARLRAMKMQNDVANRENDIREVGVRGTLVNQLEDNALRREEFADRRMARDRDSTLSLAKYNPDVIRSSVLSEQQQRVARGEISQQVADAIAQQAYENAIPVWEQIKSFSPGMLENPSRTSATPQFGQPSKATIVPGLPGYGPGGVTGKIDAGQAVDFFSKAKLKYRDGLTPELLMSEFSSAGIPITPELISDIKDLSYTDSHENFMPYMANALTGMLGYGVGTNFKSYDAVDKAQPYADLYGHLTGKGFAPRPKTDAEAWGFTR